jgi:L-arabinose isomerase
MNKTLEKKKKEMIESLYTFGMDEASNTIIRESEKLEKTTNPKEIKRLLKKYKEKYFLMTEKEERQQRKKTLQQARKRLRKQREEWKGDVPTSITDIRNQHI